MTLQCVLADADAKVALLCNGMFLIAIRVADSLNKAFRTLFLASRRGRNVGWKLRTELDLRRSSVRNALKQCVAVGE